MQNHETEHDLTVLVQQARHMRNETISALIAAGWQGARRVATGLLHKSGAPGAQTGGLGRSG